MDTVQVQDIFNPQETLAVIAPEDEALKDVILKFADHARLRSIFLTDSRQRFAGMITRHDLLNWASLRLGGKGRRGRQLSRREVVRAVFSAKAKDLARGNWRSLGVKTTDSLQEVLNQMIEYEVDYIPVLDNEGRILGGVRLSQVLMKALESN